MTVEIDIDDYFHQMDKIREDRAVRGFSIPNEVYDFFKERIKEVGAPKGSFVTILDNISINGEYYTYDDYRFYNSDFEELSDEQLRESLKDEVLGFTDNYIIISL